MSSTPTTRNRFNLQGTGDNVGSWGVVLNDQALALIDAALDGITSVAVNTDVVLTSVNYASDQSRARILKFTGAGGHAVVIPGVEKLYIIHNVSGGAVTVKTAAAAGVAVQPNQVSFVYCDSTNVYGATYTGSSSFTTKIVGPAPSAASASLNLPQGSGPTSPVNGDIWVISTGLQWFIDGIRATAGVELIASGEATAVAALDLSLPGTYRAFRLMLNQCQLDTIGASLAARVSLDAGVSYAAGASDYLWAWSSADNTPAQGGFGDTGAGITLTGPTGGDGSVLMASLVIDNPKGIGLYKMVNFDVGYSHGLTYAASLRGTGAYVGDTGEITNIRLTPDSGVFTAAYALYGLR